MRIRTLTSLTFLRPLGTALTVLALTVMGASRAAPQTRYNISDILVPSLPQGGGYAEMTGINNSGQMAGTAYVSDGKGSYIKRAYLWNSVVSMRDLGTLPGGQASGALAINNRGQVAGWSECAALDYTGTRHLQHAFLWDPVEGMRDLGTLPDTLYGGSSANGINDLGQVLAGASDKYFNVHTALWDSKNGLRDLGPTPGQFASFYTTTPIALNNRGQVLVSDYLWSPDNGWQKVADLTGDLRAQPLALNDTRQMAGNFVIQSNIDDGGGQITQPFYWDAKQGLTLLSSLQGSATRLNNSAQVIGTLEESNPGFVWDRVHGLQKLSTLIPTVSNWDNLLPDALNDKAQILGEGSHNFPEDALPTGSRFLMTPAWNPMHISLKVSHVAGGGTTVGVVTMQNPAPRRGMRLLLASSNPALVRVPLFVTLPAGATSAMFRVSTRSVTDFNLVAISATQGAQTGAALLSVTPPVDTITIQSAVYDSDNYELSVQATSSSSPAYLEIYDADTGEYQGTMFSTGGSSFSGLFFLYPPPQRIMVKSSLNGAASKDVTVR